MKKTTKPKQLTAHLFDPLYGIWTTLVVNKTREQSEKYLNKWYENAMPIYHSDKPFDGVYGKVYNKDNSICIGRYIYLRNFDWSIESQGTAAHEILHLVIQTLQERGLELNAGSEEAFTYYYTFWFETIWKKLKKLYVK